jgi:hypothetical protein
MCSRFPFVTFATVLSWLCAFGPSKALAQDCTELGKTSYSQGELYAVFERGLGSAGRPASTQPRRLDIGPFASNPMTFAPNLRLIYVLDSPDHSTRLPETPRDFSGTIVVRLVATGNQHAPTVVRLYRDAVRTSRYKRRALSRSDFPALTYYVYHNPGQLRSSNSFLDQEFHTKYVYKDGEPDRRTNDPSERRERFHFPEMKEAPPPDSAIAKISSQIFGAGTALAATRDAGFEAQIKYYPQSITPRCVKIDTRLPSIDDQALKITLTDLDYPGGLNAYGSSGVWTITWKSPVANR